MSDSRWQFWIDVGGTFTDCLARPPTGETLRHKLLSSGVTKGSIGEGSTESQIVDPLRAADPAGFYDGAKLRLLDDAGEVVAESDVATSTPQGLQLAKSLAKAPQRGQPYELSTADEAPILAVRYLLQLARGEPIPPITMRLGTTRGTNALLTRRGAKTALITTSGFADILHIGYQDRPRLFDLNIQKRIPLFDTVVEIDERVTPQGEVLRALNEANVRRQLIQLKSYTGIESLAICLLNAYVVSEHEERVERIARDVGFTEISRSSHVAPLIKLVSRGDTTVVDAYLNPVLREYVMSLQNALCESDTVSATQASPPHPLTPSPPHPRSALRIMTSAGGLVDAQQFVGKDSVLSGPAGGVVGFAAAAAAAGFQQAIGFDMGGTSTDVSRWDGRFERQYETEKAGVRIVAPMMAIETVAAGGGSICHFDGVKLCVGPQSAGADPGPACYGAGGPLTVTDLNLVLGKIRPEHFPFPLHRGAVESRLRENIREVADATGATYQPLELADGFLRIANAHMSQAIRTVSIAKGCDPRDYVLVAFGGAAGQHACAIADELGMTTILSHPDAGILSAYGIGMASVERHHVQGIYKDLDASIHAELDTIFSQLADAAIREVVSEGVAVENIAVQPALDLRYQGLDSYLTIAQPDDGDWAAAYAREHERLYGYTHDDKPLEVVAARVSAVGRSGEPPPRGERVEKTATPAPDEQVSVVFHGALQATSIFQRQRLQPGDVVVGPAIVLEQNATTIVDPGWNAEMLSDGQLLMKVDRQSLTISDMDESQSSGNSIAADQSDSAESTPPPIVGDRRSTLADPILLEIFNNHFAAIAEQMGVTLRNTASSVNVKERLDFSCAVFTSRGELVVNAPHIPVHLGAMGLTVQAILADNPNLASGDVFVTNDPYRGGSHLPDITVVTPVHNEAGQLLFLTASRAHHAEIGGVRAGSMPPFSTNLAEEGVLIRNFKLIDAGQSRVDALRDLLMSRPYPTRNVDDNLADITAQVAANRQGARDLLALVAQHSLTVVTDYMGHIQRAAETKMRTALAQLPNGRRTFTDHLDDGSPISVTLTIDGDAATIDFTGTGPVLSGNLNANRAIVTAAVMYVFRCLIGEDIPLNEGVLAPLEIILPPCLLNPPAAERAEDCAAMVGGNVETSQRVVDVLLGALEVAAASQGTMNNLLFGDETFGYYETIGGGAGATFEANGADAVHTHMTNTRLTDPEVLEQRYPVRVKQFAIRSGSGGAGAHRGGDGIIRQIEFLKSLDVSILSQRRGAHAPYGIAGGDSGAFGRNTLTRVDGTVNQLDGLAQFTARAGDVLTIETPGGGGYGRVK